MKTQREYVSRLFGRLVVPSFCRLAGDLTLVDGSAPVTPNDAAVQPRQNPSHYDPPIQEHPSKEPKSAFDSLHSRSNGSTSPTVVNVRSSRS
jgi:hypothetical protein